MLWKLHVRFWGGESPQGPTYSNHKALLKFLNLCIKSDICPMWVLILRLLQPGARLRSPLGLPINGGCNHDGPKVNSLPTHSAMNVLLPLSCFAAISSAFGLLTLCENLFTCRPKPLVLTIRRICQLIGFLCLRCFPQRLYVKYTIIPRVPPGPRPTQWGVGRATWSTTASSSSLYLTF